MLIRCFLCLKHLAKNPKSCEWGRPYAAAIKAVRSRMNYNY